MKISELIEKLEIAKRIHGDVYVSIRHTSAHEFSPYDDLINITDVQYNAEVNMVAVSVYN